MKLSLMIIPAVLFLMFVAIGFDIPVLRQIISFVFITFVPGFVILKILRPRESNLLDIVLFSAGFSVAFLMFVGLLIDELLPAMGVLYPLSTFPIILAIGGGTLCLYVVAYRGEFLNALDSIHLEKIVVIQALPLILLPVLSSVIAIYAKGAALLLIAVIAILFLASILSTKLVPVRLRPLLIFAVSISLTLQFTLMSTHVMGADSPLEYYVYKLTAINGRWIPVDYGIGPQSAYNSMLSITILPTIYSALLNINGEFVFKVLYPFLFSLAPLILYRILSRENWKLGAFLSALFFISSPIIFYGIDPLSLNRQIVAEFFFLLSVLLLLEKQFSTRKNQLVFIFFGAALAVSHYALMVVYLIFLISVFAFERVRGRSDSLLNGGVILLLLGIAFSWYALTPSSVINLLSNSVNVIISRFFSDLWNTGPARGGPIFSAGPVPGVSSAINWTLFYFVHFLVLIGIFAVMLNRQDKRLDSKYRVMIVLGAILLFLAVAIPNLAPTLNFTRYYAIAFLFLAPCFVFGGQMLSRGFRGLMNRMPKYHGVRSRHIDVSMLLIGMLVCAYFLSQSGFINRVLGGSTLSYTLDWDKIRNSGDPNLNMGFYVYFTPEQDVASATWLSKFMINGSSVYSDFVSIAHPLRIYGLISDSNLFILTNATNLGPGSYIYMRCFNIADRVITPTIDWVFNTTDISQTLFEGNLQYSNGNSQVYASQT